MEARYCSKDDFNFVAEQLKYKFVKKGHYVVRQGQSGSEVFFIIQGNADVHIWGPSGENVYLDEKSIYNEISVQRAKTKTSLRLADEAVNVIGSTMKDLLGYVSIATPQSSAITITPQHIDTVHNLIPSSPLEPKSPLSGGLNLSRMMSFVS